MKFSVVLIFVCAVQCSSVEGAECFHLLENTTFSPRNDAVETETTEQNGMSNNHNDVILKEKECFNISKFYYSIKCWKVCNIIFLKSSWNTPSTMIVL